MLNDIINIAFKYGGTTVDLLEALLDPKINQKQKYQCCICKESYERNTEQEWQNLTFNTETIEMDSSVIGPGVIWVCSEKCKTTYLLSTI